MQWSSHGTFGHSAFLKITDPWIAKRDIEAFLAATLMEKAITLP